MEHIKSLIKEKKYILLIIAALVLAEIFFFQQIWLSLAESSPIYDIDGFYGFSRIYRSAENHYTQ